jgi:hypothetical protein
VAEEEKHKKPWHKTKNRMNEGGVINKNAIQPWDVVIVTKDQNPFKTKNILQRTDQNINSAFEPLNQL